MRNLRVAAFLLLAFGLGTAHAETCVVLPRVDNSTDNVEILIAPGAMSVSGIACYCQGDCVSPIATFALHDRVGNNIGFDSTLTCAIGASDSTWATITTDPDRALTTGEGLELDVNDNPASQDTVTVCVRFE